jgi:RNA polymerase sigma factor (sigma-70 family)
MNGLRQKTLVASALAGNQEGYDFLYQSTYQKKFFIAKKYMGNDMDAQDVLQDAYVQAFTKLNTLQDYQKFPNWFGMIVANTAKNALQKKKMLFHFSHFLLTLLHMFFELLH